MKKHSVRLLTTLCITTLLLTGPVSAYGAEISETAAETESVSETETVFETEGASETTGLSESEALSETEGAFEGETVLQTETTESSEPEMASETETASETENSTETESEEDLLLEAGSSPVINYNEFLQAYEFYASPVYSYLTEVGSQLMRVELISGDEDTKDYVLVEYMNRKKVVSSRKKITIELEKFCGFFAGSSAYYMVFGQDNEQESDSREVLRVVKYDKNWKQLSALSLKGNNTRRPVHAGSLRMAEADGILYIFTCHEMYASDDGVNHQANMTFAVRESDMKLLSSQSDVANRLVGYVSHSFNQFIRIKDGTVFRVDHGDAFPRAVSLSMFDVGDSVRDVYSFDILVPIQGGTGDNYTGLSVGGLEVTSTHAVVAYNQSATSWEDTESYDDYYPVNIKLAVLDRDSNVEIYQITDHTRDEKDLYTLTPQLVQLKDDSMLLMWADVQNRSCKLNVLRLDQSGLPVSKIRQYDKSVSDCQPILLSDGKVAWYVNYDSPKAFFLHILDPDEIPADNVWKRVAGKGRYDTMEAIVKEGFSGKGGTVVVATGAGFKDALAAAGLAGLSDGPVILTDGKNLSAQAKAQLQRLKPSEIYVAGGALAVSDKVLDQIEAVSGVSPERLMGRTSTATSAALAVAGKDGWSDTAIIATNKSFKDALSAAPLSYALHMPILLADNGTSLSKEVLAALKTCKIKKAIIVGGPAAVTAQVEKQLKSAGVALDRRLKGANGVATSAAIAKYGISRGMTANKMGVATSQNFPDALAGAALCGHNRAVLLLADDEAPGNTDFPKNYKNKIRRGYVFGGVTAVGNQTMFRLWKAMQ